MVNRQDAPYSPPRSPEIVRRLLAAEIIFDGTKLALERSRPKTTTNGINCPFQLYSISQNRARRSLQVTTLPILVDKKRKKSENSADGGTSKTLVERHFKPDSSPQTAVSYPARKAAII